MAKVQLFTTRKQFMRAIPLAIIEQPFTCRSIDFLQTIKSQATLARVDAGGTITYYRKRGAMGIWYEDNSLSEYYAFDQPV